MDTPTIVSAPRTGAVTKTLEQHARHPTPTPTLTTRPNHELQLLSADKAADTKVENQFVWPPPLARLVWSARQENQYRLGMECCWQLLDMQMGRVVAQPPAATVSMRTCRSLFDNQQGGMLWRA